MTARIAEAAGFAAIMAASTAAALAWMWLAMEGIPMAADALRLGWRTARALFLAIGWAVAVGRLIF